MPIRDDQNNHLDINIYNTMNIVQVNYPTYVVKIWGYVVKTILTVGFVLIAVAFLLWGLLLLMSWLASFVGEGTYSPESKTESGDKHHAIRPNDSKTAQNHSNQCEPNNDPA